MNGKKQIGIDPGNSGGIAILYHGEIITKILDPKRSTERDISLFLKEHCLNSICCIEKVSAGGPAAGLQSARSMFTFGQSYGFLRGILTATEIPYHSVSPAIWMKNYGLKRKKDEGKSAWKNRLRGLAEQLYPKSHITLAVADAVLLADYAKCKYSDPVKNYNDYETTRKEFPKT